MMSRDIALYIHFPFCRRKCDYCNFVSYDSREADMPGYVKALNAELARRSEKQKVCSIYFGGGTPSLLSSGQIGEILLTVNSYFPVEDGAEITLEANPGTIDEEYLKAIRVLGVNRLSLGVQSLDDDELSLLGRIHSAAEAKEAVHSARNAGFTNLNMDIIYGVQGRTISAWENMIEEVVGLGAEHLSLYPLTLEENVPMNLAIKRGEIDKPDADSTADQYELAEDLLGKQGYSHYEISNWAKKGYECRHNLIYWHNLSYVGVGVAAHSYMNGHRFANTSSLDKYLSCFPGDLSQVLALDEEISEELRFSEAVILGLRLSEGVNLDDLHSNYGVDLLSRYGRQVEELVDNSLLEYNGRNLRLTRRGRLLGNEAFWRFLPE